MANLEEARGRIISQAVSAPEQISAVFERYFGKAHGVDLALPPREHLPVLSHIFYFCVLTDTTDIQLIE